ncbi:MAG: hypothetical protein IPK71_10400 [Myxococcales bacterium]|jgi:hypothetical protein|nr:hypothetical protein [Myxococcales bacterium]
MKIITFGEIVDAGQSVFHSVLSVDGRSLKHRFEGVIRVDNPYRSLKDHIDEIPKKVEGLAIDEVLIDFAELRFCNSNGFYVIMDIVEAIYTSASDAKVTVRRLDDDDWQRETLPILLNVDDESIGRRTSFTNVRE